ncbi:hypothetical protein NAV11_16705 [Pseudomonas songnenensis]|uniref:hypothetical protein n=1 Tax=Pseudomonas songnenensis TaxID=1176259 RepID=UPI00142D8A5B|nr:hypothetical protein [Pseudomonas songnenensis]MCQ4301553.1 hypothetical protein [Pseudomonas songnenensis]
MKKGCPTRIGSPFFAPVWSEQQLEYPDHHDQADDEDDARGPADEFQHAVLSRFPKSVIL